MSLSRYLAKPLLSEADDELDVPVCVLVHQLVPKGYGLPGD
jgi:hypothetical protein